MESVTVHGVEVPAIGFGTARMDTYEERRQAVSAALETGYRHIDTAQKYGSEGAVGDAISESNVDRDDVFLTTKLARGNRHFDGVIESTRASCERLGTDYVDLLLIHSTSGDVRPAETLAAMNELRDEGVVRHVGVSNFSVEQTREAVRASDAPIFANQVEYHVYENRDELLEYCIDEGIMLTAYSPLDVGNLADDDALAAIGERHGKTAGQVALRWLIQQPMVSAIPMSATPAHIRENFDVFDFELRDEEMRELLELDRNIIQEFASKLGL